MFVEGRSISDYYREAAREIELEISRAPESYILAVDIEQYVTYFFGTYFLPEIEFDTNRERAIEKFEKIEKIDNKNFTIQLALWVRIYIPIVEKPKNAQALKFASSVSNVSSLKMDYQDSCIIIEAPASENETQSALNDVMQQINFFNMDVRSRNETLRASIREIIGSRKSKIENEDAILEKIAQKISVPVRYRSNPTSFLPVSLKIRQNIEPILPPKVNRPIKFELECKKFGSSD